MLFILPFRINNKHFCAEHEVADAFKFNKERFSRTGLGEYELVRVLERKAVKDNKAAAVLVDPIENTAVARQRCGGKRKRRCERRGVHVSHDFETINAGGDGWFEPV